MNEYMPLDLVEIGNRTSKTLAITYDGKQWPVPPYPQTIHVPRIVAQKGVAQHPVMGTEDPAAPTSYESLLFVVGWQGRDGGPMPNTPIEQSDAVERLDRSLMDRDAQNVAVVAKRTRAERPQPTLEGAGALFKGSGSGD